MLCCKFVYFVFSTVIYFNWNALIVAQANKEWDLFALLNANEPPHPEKKGNALNKRHRGLQPSEGKTKSPQVTVLLQVSQTGCISGGWTGRDNCFMVWAQTPCEFWQPNPKFSFIALQEFSQISTPVADNVLSVLFWIFISGQEGLQSPVSINSWDLVF